METKNNEEKAFPKSAVGFKDVFGSQEGMSLRDYFAAHAPISNFIAPAWTADLENIEKNAEFAYRWADAMLRAKNL